ncbi:hypothetical protein [Janthinobacterium sp. PC23-8]|uniref:hypothetical protein n=1 Tax=Janthinobacterium sp. PC23-8 TaxID=2012679 RepID=UPI00113FC8C7|nr:hypothetical protein [Janthinobacterium sp. PC23-8]
MSTGVRFKCVNAYFQKRESYKLVIIFNSLPNLESNYVNWDARKGNVPLPGRRKSTSIRIVSVLSIRSEIRKIAPSQPRDSDARLLVEWPLVQRRSGRRCAVQVATAYASLGRVEQGYVEPIGHIRAAHATGDFQYVAITGQHLLAPI